MSDAAAIDWASIHRLLATRQADVEHVLHVTGARLEALLQSRAQSLAARGATARAATRNLHVLSVRAGSGCYGLELARLAGIHPFERCTPLSRGPDALRGLLNVRGEIWTVFELRLLLGLAAETRSNEGAVVLLRHPRRRIGIRIDETLRIFTVSPDALEKTDDQETLIKGVTREALSLIDIEWLWSTPELSEGERHDY